MGFAVVVIGFCEVIIGRPTVMTGGEVVVLLVPTGVWDEEKPAVNSISR